MAECVGLRIAIERGFLTTSHGLLYSGFRMLTAQHELRRVIEFIRSDAQAEPIDNRTSGIARAVLSICAAVCFALHVRPGVALGLFRHGIDRTTGHMLRQRVVQIGNGGVRAQKPSFLGRLTRISGYMPRGLTNRPPPWWCTVSAPIALRSPPMSWTPPRAIRKSTSDSGLVIL